MNQYGQWAGDMYGGPLMDRDAGPPIPNINNQITLDSLMPLPEAFPGLPSGSHGFGIGRTTPLDWFGGRNQDQYVTPNISDETMGTTMGLVPILGTIYNWDKMGLWERAFSIGLDLTDVVTLMGSKPLTAALRAAPNPLEALRLIPGSSYGEPSTFIRVGAPPGSPHVPHPRRQVSDYDVPVFPPKFKPLDIPEGGFETSINWGTPGGYREEAGISAYQVLPFDHLQAQHGRNVPLSAQHSAEELGLGLPMYYVRNPVEQGIPTSAVNRPVMRGDLDITSNRYLASPNLQKDTLGWDESIGVTDIGLKHSPNKDIADLQKGTYMIEGYPVQSLGADFETLVNPQRITQYHRTDPSNFKILNPRESAEVFKNYDIYGRPKVPGGLHPFGFLPDAGLHPWATTISLPFTTGARTLTTPLSQDEKDNNKTLANYIEDIVNENLSMWGNYATR